MCPDWELNRWHFSSALNPLSHTSQVCCSIVNTCYTWVKYLLLGALFKLLPESVCSKYLFLYTHMKWFGLSSFWVNHVPGRNPYKAVLGHAQELKLCDKVYTWVLNLVKIWQISPQWMNQFKLSLLESSYSYYITNIRHDVPFVKIKLVLFPPSLHPHGNHQFILCSYGPVSVLFVHFFVF